MWTIRRRKLLVSGAMIVLAAILGFAGLLYWQATAVPEWYRPPALTAGDRDEIQRTSFDVACRINNPMHGGRPYEIVLRQDEINRWLGMPDAVVPDLCLRDVTDKMPSNLREPMVLLRQGRATFVTRIQEGARSVVVSLTFEPRAAGDQVALKLTDARIGKLPIPVCWIASYLASNRDALPGGATALEITERIVRGEPFPNEFVWPNGRRRFKLTTIVCEDGVLRLVIEPGRTAARRP